MNRINYRNQMLEIINGFEGRVPTLLLHDCCAPCLSSVLEQLSPRFRITVFFYNPNILPEDEYQKRAAEVKRLLNALPQKYPARFTEGRYNVRQFLEMARGREQEPEGGERCADCYRLRLEETAKYARAGGYDFFATTLTVSPYKDAQKLNEIGQELSRWYAVPYLPSDFKKNRGYQRSIELSREYGLYRQDFCGCPFSKEAARRKRAARGGGEPD